ncbi:MAG: nitrite reductase small subunit NirD [Plectolyngbya sp. WJT66-NPBG17]|jgi:nitrite reductase (NADH) small subunit|nr:nitrite reductase small subunit NirD [Plectolyngbya sp. WJT66-NPBG17]
MQPSQSIATNWLTVCDLEDILPNTGVCALVEGQQVAIFRAGQDALYAIDNYDPFSKAYVLSRGIVGDRNGVPKVASPIYKQNFNLKTGECFDDASVVVRTLAVQLVGNQVQVSLT